MSHGRSGYSRGCRCIECTQAQRDYAREWKRSKASPAIIECPGCGVTFTRNGRRRWCSPACKSRTESRLAARAQRRAVQLAKAVEGSSSSSTWVWIAGICAECGCAFIRHGQASPYCGKACSIKVRRRARRALARGGPGAHTIHERDAWTCHICGDPVNREAVVPALDAPTLDHVTPLAASGTHTEDNLKTAHFYCNSVKRDLPLDAVA